MLEELHVAGLGVVEEATLELAPGLNVLTGETGAGKTMITVALALALGARASPGLVRPGHRWLAVEARFTVDSSHPAFGPWADDGGDGAPDHDERPRRDARPVDLVLARRVGVEGRSSARVGGRLAPVSALTQLGQHLVEIHGQHEVERLLAPAAQTAFLDRFCGPDHLGMLERYRRTHRELGAARRRLAALDAETREREREKDLLGYQIREIEAAAVRPGELAALAEEESRLSHAERILSLCAGAEDALGAEGAAADRLREAASALQVAAEIDGAAAPVARRLAGVVAEVDDLLVEARGYREAVEVDPPRLETVRERLRAIGGLERKYGEGEEGILAYLQQARTRLRSLEGRDADREGLESHVAALAGEVRDLAGTINAGRAEGAPRLADALTAEIGQLGMRGARLSVRLVPLDEPGPDGAEGAEFVFSGDPAQPPQPLSRVASGGELSRVMLAGRSVLADLDDVPTLVFDEIDTGIGGRTAIAVADRLARVARRRQVLVVTHLAQIAARADRHFLVTKAGGVATVRDLDGDEQVRELARMLSGTIGEVSLAHARELIAAGRVPSGEGVRG